VLDLGKSNILGVQIRAIDYEAAVQRVIAAAERHERLTVSALAVQGVMTGVLDPAHQFRLNYLDLVVPDGQPVRWALRLLHRVGLPDRVHGPTLMQRVCEVAALTARDTCTGLRGFGWSLKRSRRARFNRQPICRRRNLSDMAERGLCP
jgi:UDP-N-acetyl-D-mannosaminuronic acid transferase (WecB/TagA/CpsF family)